MIAVEMNADVRGTKTKVVKNFTLRQTIYIGIGFVIATPIALSLPIDDWAIKVFLWVLLMIPTSVCGWISFNNAPFEVVLILFIYKHFLTPMVRKELSRNSFRELQHKIEKKEKAKKYKNLSKAKKKQFQKKKKVSYSNVKTYY